MYDLLMYGLMFIDCQRCFPHIVNLACKAVLASITEHRDVFSDSNPIANVRALVNAVCLFIVWKLRDVVYSFFQIRSSSLWCQYFNEIVKTMHQKELQLLHDVDTCWSSTLLMIECALELKVVCLQFFQ